MIADASSSKTDAYSSGEYSGVLEQATAGVGIKKDNVPILISSGTAAKDKRRANRDKKKKGRRKGKREIAKGRTNNNIECLS